MLKNKDRCEKNEIHWVWNVKLYYCLPLIISFLLSFNFRGFFLGCRLYFSWTLQFLLISFPFCCPSTLSQTFSLSLIIFPLAIPHISIAKASEEDAVVVWSTTRDVRFKTLDMEPGVRHEGVRNRLISILLESRYPNFYFLLCKN